MASNTNIFYDEGSIDITATADEAITSSYLGVKMSTDGDVTIADAGTACVGIAQEVVASGAEAIIRIQGVSFARISTGSINAGLPVKLADNGYVVAATDGDFVIGKTIAAASGVDAVVPIIILPGGYQIEDVV